MNFANNQKAKKYRLAFFVLALVFLVTVGWGSFHIYDYTEHDPKFCVNCHLMNKAFESWQTSVHKGVECHDCHYATVWEKNQMLLKTFMERPSQVGERPHEKIIVPSTMCIKCHWAGKKEIAKISESTGHAMHWFKGRIECTSCHAIQLHKFSAEQKFCENCHAEGKKVLAGMQDMPCTSCHDFRRGGHLWPKAEACLDCHADKKPAREEVKKTKETGIAYAHDQITCLQCHANHAPEKKAKEQCGNCHRGAMKRAPHPQRMKPGVACDTCHAAH